MLRRGGRKLLGNLMVRVMKCDFNVHTFRFITKPYRLWYIRVHIREKFRSPSLWKGLTPVIHQTLWTLKFYSSTTFKLITPSSVSVYVNFNLWCFCCACFLSISSAGLWVAWGKTSWLIYLCTSGAWLSRNTHQTFNHEPITILGGALMGPTHICCSIKILSKPTCMDCHPWWCCFILLFNFIFISYVWVHQYINQVSSFCRDTLMTRMPVARGKKKSQRLHIRSRKECLAADGWPRGPVGGECFERI